MSAASRVDATDVECPVCDAWVGWACEGPDYGYHAAGYHPSRQRAADRTATTKEIDLSTEMAAMKLTTLPESGFTTMSSIMCARPACGATLCAETINGTDIIPIVAERKGWLGLTSGWYCPCCRSPECTH